MSGYKYSSRYIMGHTLKHNIEETGRIINSIMTILSENF